MLVAAFVLLGLGVVFATAWLVPSASPETAQEPTVAPMPAEVPGDGKDGIAALPITTENLQARFTDPRELPVVTRFASLRRLRLWPVKTTILSFSTGAYHRAWAAPPMDLLQPLAKLEHLEVLGLPHELAVTPELLAPLAGHPSLREIQFVRDAFTIDARFVAALARIPNLRALDLRFVRMSGSALHHLAALPLRSLELQYGSGLDAAGWRELLTMRSLERLSFRAWNWPVPGAKPDAAAEWQPTPLELGRLRELPRLRDLELLHCAVDDAQLAALPDTLVRLHLFGSKLTPEGIGALRRLLALRELDFDASRRGSNFADLFTPDSEAAGDAFAVALPTLRLRKLHYRGAVTADVARAIGAQAGLRDLAITSKQPAPDTAAVLFAGLPLQRVEWHAPVTADLIAALGKLSELRELEVYGDGKDGITELAALAEAPRLERLVLAETRIENGIPATVLAPLARSRSLRDVDVHVTVIRGEPRASQAELQQAVGERIRLRLHESEQTVKR
ncbi:MAG: hypothetical protein IPK26_20640 [Planctomycetes bacterium]|nr:hypothetical protein [Planctomycetota bacterium]